MIYLPTRKLSHYVMLLKITRAFLSNPGLLVILLYPAFPPSVYIQPSKMVSGIVDCPTQLTLVTWICQFVRCHRLLCSKTNTIEKYDEKNTAPKSASQWSSSRHDYLRKLHNWVCKKVVVSNLGLRNYISREFLPSWEGDYPQVVSQICSCNPLMKNFFVCSVQP